LLDGLEILLVDKEAVRKGHRLCHCSAQWPHGGTFPHCGGQKKESFESFLAKLSPEQKAFIYVVCIDHHGAYLALFSKY
jgi:hypothetical protein